MMLHKIAERPFSAAIARLNALSPLDGDALAALTAAAERPRKCRAKREFVSEGKEIGDALLILEGWAARQRILEDGRRQIIDILLPGDLIGSCHHERPLASSSVTALTDVEVCVAPDRSVSPALTRAYALSGALSEVALMAQVTRLGRMSAQDRVADFLLDLLDRLEIAGLAANGRYDLPLTQELIADTLGLTPVHINRTLQALRREGAIDLKGRALVVMNPAALRRRTGRAVTRVTAA